MRTVGNKKAGVARRLMSLVAAGAFVLPGAVAMSPVSAAATPPTNASAPLPCEATMAQMINDLLFSGAAGERKLIALVRSPGQRLLPATGGASPQAALLGGFEAKTPSGRCSFETTAYVAAPLGVVVALMSLGGPQGQAFRKKLESLSPAQKRAVINAWVTGRTSGFTSLLGLGHSGRAPGGGGGPGAGSYRDLKVKVTKLTPTTAVMTVSGLEAGTETIGGHTTTMWFPFSEPGIQASKIDGRWFLSGLSGLGFSVGL